VLLSRTGKTSGRDHSLGEAVFSADRVAVSRFPGTIRK